VAGLAILVVGTWVVWLESNNFHPILDGLLYRSGQLNPKALDDCIVRYDLRSIVNLRGPHPTERWYQDEQEVAHRHDVRVYDLTLISSSPPTTGEMRRLVRILLTCPKPALIHCQSGIDRSGLVAAVAVLLLGDVGSPGEALAELHLWYGHLPWRRSSVWTTNLVRSYERWLAASDVRHSRERFREWARRAYTPDVLQGEGPGGSDTERDSGREPARPESGRAEGVTSRQ
jgi:hypothetical protein